MRPMLPGVVQVEVHLAGVRMGELPKFKVNEDQALQAAMEENQVDPIPLVPHPEPFLSGDEREVGAQFQ